MSAVLTITQTDAKGLVSPSATCKPTHNHTILWLLWWWVGLGMRGCGCRIVVLPVGSCVLIYTTYLLGISVVEPKQQPYMSSKV